MNAKLRSMRARMTALFALYIALLMLLVGATVQHREKRRAEKRAQEILNFSLERARDEIEETQSGAEKIKPNAPLLQIIRTSEIEITTANITLMVAGGEKILWKSRTKSPAWPAPNENWRTRTLPYRGQTLIMAYDWRPVEVELQETARVLCGLGALIVGATTLAAWLVVGKTLSPLDKLAAQAQSASIESLQVRLQSPSSDAEMRHLTQTLNELLSRLEKEAQARGRFYAAASHELRTPIQVLLGQIDVARSRPRSVESHENLLAQLQNETERLATLVQDLLQLNALEMGQNQAPHEKINLAFWVQRALDQQKTAISERALLHQNALCDFEIEAPIAHIEILLRNLLENAVKYAKPQSELKIQLKTDENGAQLRIWNACDLPENADLSSWFEPFFRPDASRNSQTGGNGLGLSIVAALARANGWKIELRAHNGGVWAQVRF